MQIISVPQQSKEWFELRQKMMTASHAQAIGSGNKGLKTYITELMQEFYSSKEKKHFKNGHTERGNSLEDSAAFLYSMMSPIWTKKVGFVKYSDCVGCSPDLLAGEFGLAEIKCPDDKEYFRLLIGGPIGTGYEWQCQAQMLICKRNWNDMVFYNPNYKKKIIVRTVFWDPEKFEALEKGFEIGEKLLKEIEAKMDKILL